MHQRRAGPLKWPEFRAKLWRTAVWECCPQKLYLLALQTQLAQSVGPRTPETPFLVKTTSAEFSAKFCLHDNNTPPAPHAMSTFPKVLAPGYLTLLSPSPHGIKQGTPHPASQDPQAGVKQSYKGSRAEPIWGPGVSGLFPSEHCMTQGSPQLSTTMMVIMSESIHG